MASFHYQNVIDPQHWHWVGRKPQLPASEAESTLITGKTGERGVIGEGGSSASAKVYSTVQ
jgi:hypothetical protein